MQTLPTSLRLPLRLPLRLAAGLLAAAAALALAWPALAQAAGAVPAAALAYAPFAACGLLAGLLSGLLGIGGSLVVVPALYLLLPRIGVDAATVPHVAVGTSLLAMIPTATAAALAQFRRDALDLRWMGRLGPVMAAGAIAGALLALQLKGSVLALLFAVQSAYYAIGLLRQRPPGRWRARMAAAWGGLPPTVAGPLSAGFCACAGMGAGSMTVPWLLARQVPLLRATATSSALNLTIAAAGALVFVVQPLAAGQLPPVCWPAAVLVAGCALLSVRTGVALAHRLPLPLLRRLLGGVTLAGVSLLLARTLGLC